MACSTPTNAKGLMKAAIRDYNPVLFFEHVLLYNLTEELPEGDYVCALDPVSYTHLTLPTKA